MQVLCAAWTADGQHLALGMYNGHISISDKSGIEQVLRSSLLSSNHVISCSERHTNRSPVFVTLRNILDWLTVA